MPRHLLRPNAATALAVALLILGTGCGGDDSSDAPAASQPTQTSPAPSPEPEESPTEPAGGTDGTGQGDICSLLTDAEATNTLGKPAVKDPAVSFGTTGSDTGGQCVWTSASDGNSMSADSATVELVFFGAGTMNKPPAGSPTPGSADVVTQDNMVLFATATENAMIRVAGKAANDAQAIQKAKALVAAVRGRL